MTPTYAILLGSILATVGWLYSARRARLLSRKQHTTSVILQANFNAQFLAARGAIAPHIKAGTCPQEVIDGGNEELRAHFRQILNHYEFVAAGLRNGDFDEKLLKDSERATYVQLFRCCQNYIWAMRDSRDRMTLYEHLEWVHRRWTDAPPRFAQRQWEFVKGRPVYGKTDQTKP